MTTRLKTGESRRAYAAFGDVFADLPMPTGGTFQQIIAVEEANPSAAVYAPPPLESLTLFLTVHGHAELSLGSHSLAHRPGRLVVVPSHSRIVERVAPEQPWHVRYLLLTGPWADQMDGWLRRQEPAKAAWVSSAARSRQVFSEMVDLALTQERAWQWLFLSRSAELWGLLYADASTDAPGDALPLRVAALLDGDMAARPTVAEMAACLQVTPRQLLYRFHKETGEPLAQWSRRRRVGAAWRLLSRGGSVAAVAEQLGFANPYHFSRAFKAVTGVSPSAVRSSAGQGTLHTAETQTRSPVSR